VTKNDFLKLERRLLEYIPGFELRGGWMFIPPAEPVLRGIQFDGSSFDKVSFSVTTFLMPLCLPTSHLWLNFGHRIQPDRWKAVPDPVEELGPALKAQAMPFLSSTRTLWEFVKVVRADYFDTPRENQAIAYALIRSGRVAKGRAALEHLLEQLDLSIGWQRDLAIEADRLKGMLESDPAAAINQLKTWEFETQQHLGLVNKPSEEKAARE